jgi:hypothetical protein
MTPEAKCILPSQVKENDMSAVEKMVASHVWKSQRVERQPAGLYIHQNCPRCGTECVCILREHNMD